MLLYSPGTDAKRKFSIDKSVLVMLYKSTVGIVVFIQHITTVEI
jgi:hypothetical protein